MNVLMISGDKNILCEGSGTHARFLLQRGQVERLDVFVWPQVHSQSAIYRAAKKTAYDVVTAQDPFWRGFLAWRIARKTGAKLNLQVHTDLSSAGLLRRTLSALLLRHADSVRVVSDAIAKQVRSLGITVPVHVLPIFVDVEQFRRLAPSAHGRTTILWIGRFEDEKDPLLALTVLAEVREKGVDATLVMLGSGSLAPSVRKAAGALPVELPGWQDPRPYLEKADVVLCTSKHESWGASMIEALAAGVPVVAPDVGVAREAGAIVAPRSELAAYVAKVLHSGERGILKLPTLNAEEWARAWKETLI
jgi:glycosyltransferase involved in cell wall biosynthesis